MARFFVPLVCFAVFSLGSCAIPTNWDQLLGSDAPLFSQSVNTVLSATNGPVLHSRVLRELSSILDDPEFSTQIYAKYLAEYEKPERRNYINVFKKNLMLIAKRNLLFHTKKSSWEEGVNQFTDMPNEELSQYFGGLPKDPIPPTGADSRSAWNITLKEAPESLDWRDKGAVGPVKNQGSCGSCWSFSANAALEGSRAINTGKAVVPLSEQELVDCHKKDCAGEFPYKALDYIKSNGIATEKSYPYTSGNGRAGTCKKKRGKVAKGLSYIWVEKESEYKENCATYGPFSCCLYFHGDMSRQKSGVYDGECGKDSNGNNAGHHAIAIVGYGNEDGLDYWIIKNSWGTGFADNGYFKIRANVDKCGLESYLGGVFVTSSK